MHYFLIILIEFEFLVCKNWVFQGQLCSKTVNKRYAITSQHTSSVWPDMSCVIFFGSVSRTWGALLDFPTMGGPKVASRLKLMNPLSYSASHDEGSNEANSLPTFSRTFWGRFNFSRMLQAKFLWYLLLQGKIDIKSLVHVVTSDNWSVWKACLTAASILSR